MGNGGIRKRNVENLAYNSSLFRTLSNVNNMQIPNFLIISFKNRLIKLFINLQFCIELKIKTI